MRLIVTLLLLSIAASATAAVYKWVQPDGSIIYSDHPPQDDASPANLPPVQEIKIAPPPPAPPEPETDNQTKQTEATGYTKLAITEPADDSTLRVNNGQVSVKLALDPPLHEGDSFSIMMDGKELGQGKSPALSLTNVDRGAHTLQAAVKDAQGKTVISSSTITFHLQRTSVLQPKRQATP